MELSRPINTRTADGRRVALLFEAAAHGGGLVVCGWCKDWLRINRALPAGSVSHGMCSACEAKMAAELQISPAAPRAASFQSPGRATASTTHGPDKEETAEPAPGDTRPGIFDEVTA